MEDLPDTSATQDRSRWLGDSVAYLRAAGVLIEKRRNSNQILSAPTSHLLGHGIELFLKSNLISCGEDPSNMYSFGHDLSRLWNDDRSGELRSNVLLAAHCVWNAARQDPSWQDGLTGSVESHFSDAFASLAKCHFNMLRYPNKRPLNERVYRPFLLHGAFERSAESLLRDWLIADRV